MTSTLAAAGIAATPVFTGNGDRDDVAAIWLEHVKAAFDGLAPGK